MAATLVLMAAALLASFSPVASEFCVCRSDQSTAALQKAIDFSCGDGADCTAILEGGGCYNPNTVASHCSWAANSYYQNNKAKGATCDFDGVATISTTDPSFSGCTFPSSASTAATTAGNTTAGGGTATASGTFSSGFGAGANGTAGMGSSTLGSLDAAAAAGLLPRVQLAAAFFLAVTILSLLAL